MQNLILGSWAMISCLVMKAQEIRAPLAAPYPSMTAYSRSFSDAFSSLSQPAATVTVPRSSFACYGEHGFLLAELGLYRLGIVLPVSSGRFGFQAAYAGSPLSRRSSVSLGYARKLGKWLDLGLRFNYHALRISGYGQAQAPSVDAGVRFQVTDRWHTGFSVLHYSRPDHGKVREAALPTLVSLGTGYEFSRKLFLTALLEKEAHRPVNLVSALLYRVLPALEWRMGIATATSQLWGGVGIRLRPFWAHVTAQYHPQLGFTPGLLLLFDRQNAEP